MTPETVMRMSTEMINRALDNLTREIAAFDSSSQRFSPHAEASEYFASANKSVRHSGSFRANAV